MIEQIAYMALLSAPELASGTASLASGASSFAGTLVERVGSRFAAGVYDGFREKVSGDASRLGNTLLGALGRPMTSFTEGLSETASQVFSSALKEEGVTLADADELRILRKLAADVSDGRDPGPVLQDLKRFYAEQTANAKKLGNSMRKTFLCLTACLVLGAASLPAMAAAAAPTDALPPALKDFNDLNVTMQSRVCGELMTNMALAGVQALEAQADGAIVPTDKRQPVYETAAQALVLLSMAGGLPVEDRLRAGGVTVAIGKLSSQAQVDTTRFCQRRVAAWIKAKQVKRDYIDKAYEQAKIMMDRAFDAVEQQNQSSESNQNPIAESVAQ